MDEANLSEPKPGTMYILQVEVEDRVGLLHDVTQAGRSLSSFFFVVHSFVHTFVHPFRLPVVCVHSIDGQERRLTPWYARGDLFLQSQTSVARERRAPFETVHL